MRNQFIHRFKNVHRDHLCLNDAINSVDRVRAGLHFDAEAPGRLSRPTSIENISSHRDGARTFGFERQCVSENVSVTAPRKEPPGGDGR